MAIKARISRSANAIGSKETTSRWVQENRVSRKLNKTAQGGCSAHIMRDKSDPNMTSQFKTSSSLEESDTNWTKNNKTKNLIGRQGIVEGFSKMIPLQELTKPHSVKSWRKSAINNDIRKVTMKKDLWQRKTLDGSSKSHNCSMLMKAPQQKEGQRPVLKMPACIPKAHRKLRYNITVVGNEIKLVDSKTKGYRLTSEFNPFTPGLPLFGRRSSLSRNKWRRTKKNRRKKTKKSDGLEMASRNESVECIELGLLQSIDYNGDRHGGDGMVIGLSGSEMVDVADPSNFDGLRKIYRFSDRRTKVEKPLKAIQPREEILLERLDPISNILSTELLDSVKRCESIIDFVTAPMENACPPFKMKQTFYDTTVMEELNFPSMTTAELSSSRLPELNLVPTFSPEQVRKSLSVPNLSTSISRSRSLYLPGRKKKKKPKIETILATRPKGFQHAKWLEKTVKTDSILKSKLLQDVIISQVKKYLKRQAELRQKLQSNSEARDQRCVEPKSRQKRLLDSSNSTT